MVANTLEKNTPLEERAKLIQDARKFNDERQDEQGNLSAEDQGTFDKMLDDAADILKKVKREDARRNSLNRLQEAEAHLSEPANSLPREEVQGLSGTGHSGKHPTIKVRAGYKYKEVPAGQRGEVSYRDAFDKFLRLGSSSLSPAVYNALQSDDDEQSGYLVVSEQFVTEMLKEVDDLLFIRQHARIHTVPDASSLGIRKRTAKMSTFAWSAELQAPTADTALKYGKKVLTPHHLTGEILVSRDLLRRSIMGVSQIISEEMSINASEVMEDGFLTGNGSQQPLGLYTASADGISTGRDVSTGNTTTSITADGLREAKYALKAQYRRSTGSRSGARWLFHRDGLKMITKLKDGEGQYLLRPGLSEEDPDRILGLPMDESERSPNTFTTGLYVGLLGNYRYYEIADALDMELQRLDELHARTNQVGFIGRIKTDGMPTLEEAFVRVTLA